MSISVSRVAQLTVTETFSSGFVSTGDATITVNGLNASGTYTSSTTVTVTEYAVFSKALSTGTATIDLTSLTDAATGRSVSGDTQKVQMFAFSNPATNANDISVTFGASNPYLLMGTGWKITLKPGQNTGPIFLDAAAPTIGSGARNIDLAGTGSQALDCLFVFS